MPARDAYGFEVKNEFIELYIRYAPLWEKEEGERCQRWSGLLETFAEEGRPQNLARVEDELIGVQALEEAVLQWRKAASKGQEGQPEWFHPLRSLVQAGIPMAYRGQLWRCFLNVEEKAQEGVYDRLVSRALGRHFSSKKTPRRTQSGQVEVSPETAQHAEAGLQEAEASPGQAAPPQPSTKGAKLQERISGQFNFDIAKFAKIAEESRSQAGQGPDPAAKASAPEKQRPTSAKRDWNAQIEKDLHRTFPGHPVMDSSGRNALRRLLAAYARRNPSVGYCQGMNFVAGCLLLFMDEEDAFWSLACIIEDLLPGYYSTAMVEPQVDQLVFRHLVDAGFPRLAGHLEALGAGVAGVSTQWFLCLFVNSLPLETCLRVWDLLFFERCSSVLFRVALALVDIYAQALMATVDSIDAFSLLQNMAPMSYDSSRLVDVACIAYAHVDDAHIKGLRAEFLPIVEKQFQDRFGKAPDVIRRTSDVDEGLCFEWAPAVMPLPDSPASAGAVAITGPYMPLQGSLLPDTDLESFPVQHSLAALVDAQTMEVAQPRATPEAPIENKRATGLPEAAEVHKEEDAAEAAAASSAPGLGKSDNEGEEEEDVRGSPTSISSWHGTPTWNDITTFSQQTLKHLSRLSNTVLSDDECACLANGELPPGMVTPPSPEPKQLTEEEHAELASQSQLLAARLPKLNLSTPKRRTVHTSKETSSAAPQQALPSSLAGQNPGQLQGVLPAVGQSRTAAALSDIAAMPAGAPEAGPDHQVDSSAEHEPPADLTGTAPKSAPAESDDKGRVPDGSSGDEQKEDGPDRTPIAGERWPVPPLKAVMVVRKPKALCEGASASAAAHAVPQIQNPAASKMLSLVDSLEEELFAAEARRHDAEVAAEALVATEQDLRNKIRGLDEEIDNKRDLLGMLVKRHDDAAAELAGADANLTSAGALLDNAKAHLALKTSLLFEKEMLIANIQKKASAAEKGGEGSSRLWSIFGRRNSPSGPQSDRPSTWREL